MSRKDGADLIRYPVRRIGPGEIGIEDVPLEHTRLEKVALGINVVDQIVPGFTVKETVVGV